MADIRAVSDEMKEAGVWVFAGGLHPPETASVVRGDLVTDGPFIEAKEHLGGFTVIEVAGPRCRAGVGAPDLAGHHAAHRGAALPATA